MLILIPIYHYLFSNILQVISQCCCYLDIIRKDVSVFPLNWPFSTTKGDTGTCFRDQVNSCPAHDRKSYTILIYYNIIIIILLFYYHYTCSIIILLLLCYLHYYYIVIVLLGVLSKCFVRI